MTYRVTRNAHQQAHIVLDGEPPYCTSLAATPAAREPELDNGQWLVMAFATWSMPDVALVQTALDAVKRFEGRVKLGVRPFDDFEEFRTWNPESAEGNSPVWILLLDGQKCWEHQGPITIDALVEVIEDACRDQVDV